MQAKGKLCRQSGTSGALFPSYLHEFMFTNDIRMRHGLIFVTFVTHLLAIYLLRNVKWMHVCVTTGKGVKRDC